jgi:hypothetical protein
MLCMGGKRKDLTFITGRAHVLYGLTEKCCEKGVLPVLVFYSCFDYWSIFGCSGNFCRLWRCGYLPEAIPLRYLANKATASRLVFGTLAHACTREGGV